MSASANSTTFAPPTGIEVLVRDGRAAQGLPPKIEDAAILARVANILKAGGRDDR